MNRPQALLLALVLCGCTVGPDYAPPENALPAAWIEATDVGGATFDAAEWWRSFGDPVLDDLVQQAIRGNPDIAVARARVAEARIRAAAAGDDRWPKVDAAGSYSNSRLSEHGFLESFGAGSGPGGAVFPGQEINLYQAGFDASWEIDLFGSQRRTVEAEAADADAAAAEARGVLLGLCAATAGQYLQFRTVQGELRLANERLQLAHDELAVQRERATAGVAEAHDVAHAEQLAAEQQAVVHALFADQQAAMHGLERLLGLQPGRLAAQLTAPAPLPDAPDPFAVDVPAVVLARRPDVHAAERRLCAANARIGLATADLYPRLSLTGAFGLQAQHVEDVPDYDSRFWAIGPQLRWPLLDFGRVRARIDAADARSRQALATYEGTVLQALSDVEIALVRLARGRQQVAALAAAATAAGEQERLLREQYERGVLEYLDVLTAGQDRLQAEAALLQGRLLLDHAVVALGKALGGGWQGD